MISTVRVHRPAMGKQAELRALLTEWARTRQSDGADTNLLQRVYNSEAPAFASTTWHADLGALEESRKRVMASEGFGRFQERLNALLASPPSVHIYETVLPAQPAGQSGRTGQPGGIVARRFWVPSLGRSGEVQRVLKEQVSHEQSLGYRAGLSRRIMQDHEQYLVTTHLHESLADYAAWLEALQGTEEARAFFQKITPLLSKSHVVRFFEVVVPRSAK